MGARTTYRVFVGDALVAQGGITLVAEVLGVSVKTARSYAHREFGYAKVQPLPHLYDYRGSTLTAEEVARSAGVTKEHVYSAASKGQGVGGHRIRKHAYPTYKAKDAERLVDEAKGA